MRKSAYLLSVAAAALAAPAFAQDVPTTQQDAQTTAAPSTAAGAVTPTADAPRTASGNPQDIIVTANRRSERLADVPLAVSAVGQAALQNSGATDIRQLTQLAPSLLVSSTGSEANASARIRGIGTVGDNPGLESSVATFIDGVYRSRTGAGLTDLGEIDRIEVLRGPQGTLSGRNASAGVINIYTKAPEFHFGGYGEATYGNYNNIRIAGAVTGPITDTIAFRLDGVYAKRDGFLYDVVNKTDYNDRNRYFVRGQLLFEPSSDLSVRLIGDYTRRDEKCCGAVYVDLREKTDPTPGVAGDYSIAASNRIVDVINQIATAKGIAANLVFPSANDPYNRQIANTPGRAYGNITKDYGGSAQIDYKFGSAALTSITAYREYKSGGASDIDYGVLDIGYRPDDGNSYRQFKTFSQELRLQGSAFAGKLDWLVGGYYSHEDLQVVDNLKFGTDYGAFAACRIVATINPAAALRNPTASGCLSAGGRATLAGLLPGTAPAFGAATPLILSGIDRLSQLNDLGSTRDVYNQRSENYAFFTHNIFKITDRLSITAGVRYTHEQKKFDATFNNNNTLCPAQQAALGPLLTNASLASLAGGIITLTCTGNSSSQINGLALKDQIKEGEFTGTGVVSWKPIDSTLFYASYSRGYKAGGYNLDRSDLGSALFPRSNADASVLRFDPETVNAYEFGVKYSSRQFTFNAAIFRQEFSNFQLNTFNGTVYIVQNIGSCKTALNGADSDNSAATGACTGGVKYGVLSQGVELEAGLYPARNVAVNLGYTLTNTHYRNNLVGSQAGEALDPQLFLLPGSQVSNAPRNTETASISWTPDIGSSGMTALFYMDGRMTSDYNNGSDLFYEKMQDGFVTANARIGLRGRDQRYAIEFWVQNLTNTQYEQVAFSAPFQGAGSLAQVQKFGSPAFATGNQIFSAFLAEPRTYGVTLRSRF